MFKVKFNVSNTCFDRVKLQLSLTYLSLYFFQLYDNYSYVISGALLLLSFQNMQNFFNLSDFFFNFWIY